MITSEELLADNDEPPDEELLLATPRAATKQSAIAVSCTPAAIATASSKISADSDFARRQLSNARKQSLLTQMIHTSDSESQGEDENMFSDAKRAHSSASTWSRSSHHSTADEHTSDGCRSPDMGVNSGRAPTFIIPTFIGLSGSRTSSSDSIGPLQTATTEQTTQVVPPVERKRCIQFACGGRKDDVKTKQVEKVVTPEIVEPPRRACALKFVCPTRDTTIPPKVEMKASEAAPRKTTLTFACPVKESLAPPQAAKPRLASPPPVGRSYGTSPKAVNRAHRDSDATVRNLSPKATRNAPSSYKHRRIASTELEIHRSEATRFHEFASSDEEIDDWTQEATVHRNRLTVSDTLKIENNLRKACTEAEEEEEDEEDEEDDDDDDSVLVDDDDDEDEDGDDDDEDNQDETASVDLSSDDGFASDNEEGFACSDDESDAGSDFEWWAPGRRASMSEPVEHIRPTQRRSSSASSIESVENEQAINIPGRRRHRNLQKLDRPSSPELPDSTDFVCGTLDEDRPAEQAYLQHLEKRRLARRPQMPQDIDPTFPQSDPEMEEEDEDSDHTVSESDQHAFIHGQMDDHKDVDIRDASDVVPQKRSSPHSPRRLRSPLPPPAKRMNLRSPPPRRMFGASPPRRCRSPPPPTTSRLRSPPPSRRSSVKQVKKPTAVVAAAAAAIVPNHGHVFRPRLHRQTSSLPRSGTESARRSVHAFYNDEEDNDAADNDELPGALPVRTALDIVKGLEKKRQRRREKLYEKHCRNKVKRVERPLQPGKGCERMREVGIELNNYRGKKNINPQQQQQQCQLPPQQHSREHQLQNHAAILDGMHILSI